MTDWIWISLNLDKQSNGENLSFGTFCSLLFVKDDWIERERKLWIKNMQKMITIINAQSKMFLALMRLHSALLLPKSRRTYNLPEENILWTKGGNSLCATEVYYDEKFINHWISIYIETVRYFKFFFSIFNYHTCTFINRLKVSELHFAIENFFCSFVCLKII